MSNDMRIVKYETLIRDINDVLKKRNGLLFSFVTSVGTSVESGLNSSLAMIYDYDNLNDYGKVIMEQSSLFITDGIHSNQVFWTSKYSDIKAMKEIKNRIEAAKEFVKYCRMDANRSEAYKFIFWSMMMLTVDKSDADEHLSLICDFARMLKVTDNEMEDIVKVIRILLHEEEYSERDLSEEELMKIYEGGNPGFKSDTVPNYFLKVLNLYD